MSTLNVGQGLCQADKSSNGKAKGCIPRDAHQKKNFYFFPIKKTFPLSHKKRREYGRKDGRKEGREEGRKEGKKEGEKREGGRKEGRKARRGRKEGRK